MNKENPKLKTKTLTSNQSLSISNNTFFLLIIFVSLIDALIYVQNLFVINTQAWQTQMLTMDYFSYGFIRRGLLGTFSTIIKHVFNTNFVTAYAVVQFIGIAFFFISTILFFHIILKNKDDRSFCFVVLVYLAFNHYGFILAEHGLLETYNMAITVLMVYLIIKDKALFLIPPMAAICVMIHETYPMMLFGVIAALLIYRFCYAKDKASKCKYAVVFFTTGLAVSVLFFLLYFKFARLSNPDIEAVLAASRERLGANFEPSNLRTLWLDPTELPESQLVNLPMWLNGEPTGTFYRLMRVIVINAIVCSPLIFMLVRYWIGVIKSESVVYRKLLLAGCSLLVFLVLPMIVIHCDQGRWFFGIVFYEVILTGAMTLLNFNNERETLYKITKLSVPKILLVVFYTWFYAINPGNSLIIISKKLIYIMNWIFGN